MNIGFIMDPWESLDPKTDSTLRIIHECLMRNYVVGIVYPQGLTIRGSRSLGFINKIIKQDKYSANFSVFHKNVKFKEMLVPLSGFDAIFMRQDPPLDPVTLNFLDSVKEDTFIVNNIEGLRKANNKLYPASFDDPKNEIIPATHVSRSKEFLKRTILESKKDKMILKPLDGFGGSGVIVVEKSAIQNINSLLDFYLSHKENSNYVILQEFVEGAENGDVRILMLNGKAIGAYRRIPAKDDVRSNIKAGGSAKKHILTKEEKRICEKIRPRLLDDGLYFVGLDVINGKLIEINVCSPGGITKINQFNRVKLQKNIVDFIETIVENKEKAINQKKEFKRIINES
jgi:glutathione synthase